MRKILSIFAAMLVAVAVSADPVVLPATLDVNNVSFRSEGMPDFVLEEGDYAGTYFDMGAHDNPTDTLLYAEWDVTIQPMKYDLFVDVYNTNSWRVQLYLLNQAGDTVKSLRYKGSSGQKGQFAIGSLDMSDLEAGDYKLRARAATAWSQMKLKDIIIEGDYKGVNVELPGTLTPAYAELFGNASVANHAITFKPSTANTDYATWNVSFAEACYCNVSIDLTASNGHNYGVALLSADGSKEIGALNEGGQNNSTGVKKLGGIEVPAAGNYIVKLTNSIQWSEAVLNSITFAVPEPKTIYCKVEQDWWTTGNAQVAIYAWGDGVAENAAWPGARMEKVDGEPMWTIELPGQYTSAIFTRVNPSNEGDFYWGAKTEDQEIPADKNMFTITSTSAQWDPNKAQGEWELFVPAKFYITGNDALLGELAWNPAAIKVTEDSYTFENLAAGSYMLKVTEKGDWSIVKGFDALTTVEPGVTRGEGGDDDNICFTLAEAGNVTVTYTSTVFTVEGNFYVAPAAKFFITGNANLVGDKAWHSDAVRVTEDSYTFENLVAGEYQLIVSLDGSWNPAQVRGFSHLTEPVAAGLSADVDNNICFRLTETGNVTVTYTSELFKVEGNFWVQRLEDGWYLVGAFDGKSEWDVDQLTAAKQFILNTDNIYNVEYMITVPLKAGDEFKAAYVYKDVIQSDSYKPAGSDPNYIVDANHAGSAKTIYMRPNKDGGEGWHYGCLYVEDNGGGTAVDNTEDGVTAKKVVENGMLIIEKNNVRYTVTGQVIR